MEQFIYKNKIIIYGTAREVIMQIRMLSEKYSTIKELYEKKMKPIWPHLDF